VAPGWRRGRARRHHPRRRARRRPAGAARRAAHGRADRRLRSLPGIGPWTSAHIRQRACGDPDAIAVGDYHLPGVVGWALARQVVDDAGMLELLAPYAGHRHRAAELILMSGPRPPRHGPRNPVRDYRSI
jgi:hypothetical protein